ncbi:hypothetical protein [Actinoplanes sp. CA-252034]|uniref:hypothetical protein n=1 Tax=Actinoplanes sp. CA-252034 TaxID=3239906 RepID=UPI003D95FECC
MSLVTGALFRDDVIRTAESLVGDRPALLVLAGWSFVVLVAGVGAGCLRTGRLPLVTVAALTVPVVLWFLPTRADKDPFPGGGSDFVVGGQTAWITVLVTAGVIVFEDPLLRRWGPVLVGSAAVVSLTVALALAH